MHVCGRSYGLGVTALYAYTANIATSLVCDSSLAAIASAVVCTVAVSCVGVRVLVGGGNIGILSNRNKLNCEIISFSKVCNE